MDISSLIELQIQLTEANKQNTSQLLIGIILDKNEIEKHGALANGPTNLCMKTENLPIFTTSK